MLLLISFAFDRLVKDVEQNFTVPLFSQISVSGTVMCALTVEMTRVSCCWINFVFVFVFQT